MKLTLFPFFLCLILCSCSLQEKNKTLAYFGTYTSGASEGIYFSNLNTKTGQLSPPKLAAKIENPSFIAIHPNKKYLYAIVEMKNEKALVCSYEIKKNGSLKKLNQQPSGGDTPCHVTVDALGKTLLIANYNGANCATYPISSNGEIGKGMTYEHTGNSVNKIRQQAPHPHSINLNPANNQAFVADLGTDKIMIYNFDSLHSKLKFHGSIELPPGGGPRHFSFHPSGKFAYGNLELTREIVAMSYHPKLGILKKIQILSTLPEGVEPIGSTAECLVHPTGKFVYVSNRGHNSIAVFKIDQDTGHLTKVEIEPTLGKIPRGFGIDPKGKFLVVGHQKTDKVSVFKINQASGDLTFTGNSIQLNGVVNVRFLVY
jgi:6-phosphogluconolactonase